MNTQALESARQKVCEQIELVPEGVGRFLVDTPFTFPDGDYYAIVVKDEGENWRLTDEGHTLMHLSYWMHEKALKRETRQRVINDALSFHGLQENEGELFIEVDQDSFADGLYNLIQALMKITDVTYLAQERVRSTFYEDFNQAMMEIVDPQRRVFKWNDREHDPNGHYIVDCFINGGAKPLLVFALATDNKVKDATITLLKMESWGLEYNSLGIFENQEQIGRPTLARFSEVVGKQFPSLESNRDRIGEFFKRELAVT